MAEATEVTALHLENGTVVTDPADIVRRLRANGWTVANDGTLRPPSKKTVN